MEQLILDFQKYLQTKKPLGVSYNGPLDGLSSPELKDAAAKLKNLLVGSKNKDVSTKANEINIIIDDKSPIIDLPAIDKLVTEESAKEVLSSTTTTVDPKIKTIQEILSLNKVIPYAGPKDGIVTEDFIKFLSELENKINTITGTSINGKIIANNTVVVDPNDLKKTLDLLGSYQSFLASSKR